MTFRLFLSAIAILCLSGCSKPEFDEGAIKGMLEGTPITLSNEQVIISASQLECGVRDDLWEPPSGNTARLTEKGRDLKFSDDVRVADPDIHQPFTQITGTFTVAVSDVSKLRDTDSGNKLADVRLGVVISHECFTTPLPLMGVRKGAFTPDAPVVFRFQGAGKDWTLDKLVH